MLDDVYCPYCGSEQEINHDDGYGYEEDQVYEQQCSECDKVFAYETSIHFSHSAWKADCLNGSEHEYEPVKHWPRAWLGWVRCKVCGHEVRGTFDETAYTEFRGDEDEESN